MFYCYNVFVFLLQTVLRNTTEVYGNNESMGDGLTSVQNAVLIVSLRCSVVMYICVTAVSVHPVVLVLDLSLLQVAGGIEVHAGVQPDHW